MLGLLLLVVFVVVIVWFRPFFSLVHVLVAAAAIGVGVIVGAGVEIVVVAWCLLWFSFGFAAFFSLVHFCTFFAPFL